MMSYQPPKTVWEVSDNLRFDEPLEPDDPRFVDMSAARGDVSYSGLLKSLGVDPKTNELKTRRLRHYALFCGHRGCGKSTELRRLADRLRGAEAFFVVLLDGVRELDTNNLQYADVLLALAQKLLESLSEESVPVKQAYLERLQQWFDHRVETHTATKDFATEVKAGAQAESGLPFLGKLFASITNSLKTNSTYKDELRRVLKNSFSDFAEAFKQLLLAAEEALAENGLGKRVLFIVDGTDRLTGEDSLRFFIQDIHQLQLIDGLFIYCGPIPLLYEGSSVNQSFDHVFKLPMVKLAEKSSQDALPASYQAMRKLIHRRADPALFDTPETVDYLIKYSGGHPRDLLRLLDYAFEYSENEQFDRAAAEKAVRALATDYRRILEAEDYHLLCQIDNAPPGEATGSERAKRLLFNLALLEYNDFWWQSHPVVRTLPGYEAAEGSAS